MAPQNTASLRVGWIGLGNLGIEMAKNLQSYRSENGLSAITVYNRTAAKCQAVEQLGASVAGSAAAVAAASDVIFLSLFNGDAVRTVVGEILDAEAEAGEASQTPPLVIADTTTVHPTAAQALVEEIRRRREKQGGRGRRVEFAQTPVWGAPPMARLRKLVLVTNRNSAPDTIGAIAIPAFARTAIQVDDQAKAASFKILGNFMIAAIIESLGEAFAVAHESGISRETYLEFLQEVLPAPPLLGYASKMVAEGGDAVKSQVGFAVSGGMKDVGYAMDVAKSVGMRLPVAELAYEHLQWVEKNGSADWDWSSLVYALRKEATLPKEQQQQQ
ncbi:hypothetical protein LPJ72_003659 [Coemansia sp. Benny D160-2]|nr:hypothetical protein LPJ72_003659 [Coemansia sp. Benny D160-2]